MKMNWYYRMMLSYTPIFFVVISSIIFIFFLVLNNASENKYIETNKAILERMVYNTDANLMLIERNMVSKLLKDDAIRKFFVDDSKTAYDYFEIQKKLIELNSSFPFPNMIYIYNEAEQLIISESGSYTSDSFGDKDFLMSNYTLEEPKGWSDSRLFAHLNLDENKQEVVSLVKFYYDGDTKLGAIVVNVYLHSVIDYLNSFNESDSNMVRLVESEESTVLVQSEYTGWRFMSDSVYDKSYSSLSLFSSVWMIIVMVIIVLALIGFTIVTHMHYRPIQSIMEKVGHFSSRKSEELGIKGTKNEFTFIEMALDHLLKKSLDYENLYKEDSLLREQRLFHDLLAGHLLLSDEEFEQHLAALNLPCQYDRLGVIAVEIDYYSSFTEKYNLRDQHLLKFILENAFHDLGQQSKLFVWHAWMQPHTIVYVVHHHPSGSGKTIVELADEFQKWISHNLELTVTIGVGADSNSIESITESYLSAQDNASLKTIFGTNTLIDNRRSAGKLGLDNYAYLQALESAAQSFRMHESDWREKLIQVFSELKKMRFVERDMAVFMNSFVLQMDKAITALSSSIQEIWKTDYQLRFAELHRTVETLDELEKQLLSTMIIFEAAVDEDRLARRHHSIALQAKSYVDAHYAEPDLSLSRVSHYLNLQPSALSQLFKEELGEKFIDYVLKVRLQLAKKLLVETDDSIQSIAEQVGYLNVISFYRAFKKVQDIPPGEYRNMYRNSK
mgnify:CR=1 FL=1